MKEENIKIDETNEKGIVLKQMPVITHQLKKVGESVVKRLSDLNIDGQVATVDTVQSMKKLRATLSKESGSYKLQIDTVVKKGTQPFTELKEIFKTEISEPYANAESTLKTKIGVHETKVKQKKEGELKLYFVECCQAYNIDFLIFDDVGLEINLSKTEKYYKEKCGAFVEKVVNDIELINLQEHKIEMLVEFKKDLNVSKAIKDVQVRKQSEKEEIERVNLKELNNRIQKLEAIGMSFDDMTNTYSYNDEIYISKDNILTCADFSLKVVGFEEKIKVQKKKDRFELRKNELISIGFTYDINREYNFLLEGVWSCFHSQIYDYSDTTYQKYLIAVTDAIAKKNNPAKDIKRQGTTAKSEESKQPIQQTIQAPTIEPKREIKVPLQAPVKEAKQEEFTAKFAVTATMLQLKSLKAYLEENKLTFKTI